MSALEKESQVLASIDVKPSYGLSDGEIESMLRDSMEHAGDDMQKRLLQEQKVEAARVVEAITSALQADGKDHLADDERATIDALVAALVEAQKSDDREVIKSAIGDLEKGSNSFVERRMNASVRKMMAGQGIDSLSPAAQPETESPEG